MALERTLILIKPDAVQRRLIGRVITRIEDKGLSIIGLKLLQVTPEISRLHYAEHVSKPFYPELESFITSGPLVALAIEGPEAITVMRTLMGKTNAREAAPGTIRGDLGASRQMNLIHGSDSPESAQRELAIYFRADELVSAPTLLTSVLWAKEEQ
ncbi:MAG: Nucleoside diphosphate kinase [Planctomycetota bacterium]|jgi:nucleoside-diphosphate kinase